MQNEIDATNGAIEITHYFLKSNIISMLGYVCQYNHEHHYDIAAQVEEILNFIAQSTATEGMILRNHYSNYQLEQQNCDHILNNSKVMGCLLK